MENRTVDRIQKTKIPLCHRGKVMAEREGFEPPLGCPRAVFKTARQNLQIAILIQVMANCMNHCHVS